MASDGDGAAGGELKPCEVDGELLLLLLSDMSALHRDGVGTPARWRSSTPPAAICCKLQAEAEVAKPSLSSLLLRMQLLILPSGMQQPEAALAKLSSDAALPLPSAISLRTLLPCVSLPVADADEPLLRPEDGGEREPIDGDGEAGALPCEPLPSACSIEIETAGPTL